MDQYRVLAAIRDLREFTVPQLVELSGVNPRTVRTILDRNSDLFDNTRKIETGKPGGKFNVYRVTQHGRAQLDVKLSSLYDDLVRIAPAGLQATAEFIPLGCRTALDSLERRYPCADTDTERAFILEMAADDLETVSSEIESARKRGFNVDSAQAEYERLEQLLHRLQTGKVEFVDPADFAQMQAMMLELAASVKAVSFTAETAAERFCAQYARGFRDCDTGAQTIANSMRRHEDALEIDPTNVIHFGVAPTTYLPGVLHKRSSSKGVGLFVHILTFLAGLGKAGSPTKTPVEHALTRRAAAGAGQTAALYGG